MGIEARQAEEIADLQFCLLGDFQILLKDREIKLPPSRKTRALAAYLIATGAPQRREWLCDLLWEGPDDPRGELRWSLAKIRPLLNADGTTRVESNRLRVAFDPKDGPVDVARARRWLADIPSTSTQTLTAALALFRGEFLDGLDLPTCYRFQEWCLAERAALSALRLDALRALIDRLGDRPDEALVHARALVAADPLSEDGHARVVRLLGQIGRRREALAQYEQARSVFERESGVRLSGALERARYAIGRSRSDVGTQRQAGKARTAPSGPARPVGVPLVGRTAERARIDDLVSAAVNGRRPTPLLLLTGEPGIGKSRLLMHLCERMALVGGRSLRGRAFEAETAHPYGAWIDVFRAVPIDMLADGVRQNLALLRPDLGKAPTSTDRAQLFEAVRSVLQHLGRTAQIAVILDDVQWLDESSAALLHYVARQANAPSGVMFACAARPGELADNPATARALNTLAREGLVLELPLNALNKVEVAELARAIDAGIDASAVFVESDGNPLFALELSQGYREGRHYPGRSLQAILAAQFSVLDDGCRQLVTWASALGRSFDPGLLTRLTDLPSPALLAALERLERRGIVRAADPQTYEFVHDLVRAAAYQEIAQPRRKLMHAQIARALDADAASNDAIAGELVRHGELAGDHMQAARACVLAGERSLRLFANTDAIALARRGRWHVAQLADGRLRREFAISLFRVEILASAGPGLRPLPRIVDEVTRAVADAEEAGLHAAAATGHYLLSVLHQDTGATTLAQQSTLRAAAVGRDADSKTSAQQLANTARCLVELEVDIPRARTLLAEAETLLGFSGQSVCELQWGLGLLARWDGKSNKAVARIEGALALARDAVDRWREYKCLTWLASLELERGQLGRVRERCQELRDVAEQLGEKEAPLADTLQALADVAETGNRRLPALDGALKRLRAVDDKSYLAYALNAAVSLCLESGEKRAMQAYALEALDAARALERHGEMVVAEALSARLEVGPNRECLQRLRKQVANRDRFSARTRKLVEGAAAFGDATSGAVSKRSALRR